MALAEQPNKRNDPTMGEDDDVEPHVHTTPGPHNHPSPFLFFPPSTSNNIILHSSLLLPSFYNT